MVGLHVSQICTHFYIQQVQNIKVRLDPIANLQIRLLLYDPIALRIISNVAILALETAFGISLTDDKNEYRPKYWPLQDPRPYCLRRTSSIYRDSVLSHKQLLKHFEFNGFLSEHQFGFRPNRSTELAVTFFTDLIRKEADRVKAIGAVFIDLSKAFDTISHSVLLEKLSRYGIQEKELNWFTDYLFLQRECCRNLTLFS